MPSYRVTIDRRTYEGAYGSRADAVFGVMLTDQNSLFKALTYTEARAALDAPTLIVVERLGHCVTKKAHRVY